MDSDLFVYIFSTDPYAMKPATDDSPVAYSSPEFKDGLVQPVREGFIHFASSSPSPQLPTQHLRAATATIAFMNGFKPDYHSYCLQMMYYINKFGRFGSYAKPTEEEGRYPFVF
jgi:hypothetical protein